MLVKPREFIHDRPLLRASFMSLLTKGPKNEVKGGDLKLHMKRIFKIDKCTWFGLDGTKHFYGMCSNLDFNEFEQCLKVLAREHKYEMLGTIVPGSIRSDVDLYNKIIELQLTQYPYEMIVEDILYRNEI